MIKTNKTITIGNGMPLRVRRPEPKKNPAMSEISNGVGRKQERWTARWRQSKDLRGAATMGNFQAARNPPVSGG